MNVDEMFSMNPGAQMKILQEHKDNNGDDDTLVMLMETLSTTLVMGEEGYLRAFDPNRGIPQLSELGASNQNGNGDVKTLCLRALGHILEHVPNASQIGPTCQPLIDFAATSLRDCSGFLYESNTIDSLVEEALRVIGFLAADEATQPLIAAGVMKDIVQAMNLCTGRTMRQCLDTMRAMLQVVKLTAGPAPTPANAPPPKKAKKGSAPPPPAPTAGGHEKSLSEVITVVVPTLLGTLESLLATNGVADSWNLVEGVLLCMGTMVRRMYRQDKKMPATKVLSLDCVTQLFQVLVQSLGSEKKIDLTLSILAEMAPTAPKVFLEVMMRPEVLTFYSTLIKTTDKDVTALLEDPFPAAKSGGPGGRPGHDSASNKKGEPKKSGLTISLALHLMSCTLSTLPDEIRHVNFALIPIHDWSWEDDMHSYSAYPDESSVMIEKDYVMRRDTAQVRVKSQSYDIDLWAHRQRAQSGVSRCVRRSFQPKEVRLIENFSTPGGGGSHGPVWDHERAGPPSQNGPHYRGGPCTDFHSDQSQAAQALSLRMLQTYAPLLIDFASQTTATLHRTGASMCVAQLLYGCLPTVTGEVVKAIAELGTPLCQFLAESFVCEEDATVDCALIVFDFLLHNNGNEWKFHQHASRFGLQGKLAAVVECGSQGISQRAEFLKAASSAHFAERKRGTKFPGTGVAAAGGSGSPVSSSSPTAQFAQLHDFVIQFRRSNPEEQKGLLRKFLDAVTDESITPFEFAELEVAESLCSFLMGVDTTNSEERDDDDEITPDSSASPEGKIATPPRSPTPTSQPTGDILDMSPPVKQEGPPSTPDEVDPASPASPMKEGEWELKDESELRQERISHFFTVMAADTDCMKRLVRLIVQGLTFHRGMPDAESPISSAPVRCRSVHEAVAIASSISPQVDLCSNRKTDGSDVLKAGTASAPPPPPPPPPHQLCPGGHILTEYRSTSWSCDVCEEHSSGEPSMACRKCNFDLCQSCFFDEDSGYEGGPYNPSESEPPKPKLPGYAAHIFAPLGDIETFFRTGLAKNGGGGPQDHDLQMLLAHLASEQDSDSGRLGMMHELLRSRLSELSGGTQGASPGKHTQFVNREDQNIVGSRIELYYEGAGRVDYQEPFFGVLYRKAISRRIMSALETFETCLMAFDADRVGKKVAGAMGTTPSKALSNASFGGSANNRDRSDSKLSKAGNATLPAVKEERPTPNTSFGAQPARPASSGTSRLASLAQPKNVTAKAATTSAPGKSPPPKTSGSSSRASASSSSATPVTAPKEKKALPTGARTTTMKEVAAASPTRQRTMYFHVFANNSSVADSTQTVGEKDGSETAGGDLSSGPAKCCCGEVNKPQMDKATSDFARTEAPASAWLDKCDLLHNAELTLLSLLHRVSHFQLDQPSVCGDGAPVIPDDTFWSPEISSKVVKSAVASALRVALLPPNMSLPCWVNFILRRCLFLIPNEIRFKLASYLMHGARRALWTAIQNNGVSQPSGVRLDVMAADWKKEAAGRPQSTEKVRRDHMLEDSAQLTLMNAERRFPLHINFKGDEGTGLGPTLQFFTKAAAELSRSDLGLWRNAGTTTETNSVEASNTPPPPRRLGHSDEDEEEETSSEEVTPPRNPKDSQENAGSGSPLGLKAVGKLSETFDVPTPEGFFPKVYTKDGVSTGSSSLQRVPTRETTPVKKPATGGGAPVDAGSLLNELAKKKAYYLAGSLVARALNDGRVFNLPLSPGCFDLLRKRYQRAPNPTLKSLALVDKQMAKTVEHLYLQHKKATDAVDEDPELRDRIKQELIDLDMPFSLPGHEDCVLTYGAGQFIPKDGINTTVALGNVVEFCRFMCHSICHDTVVDYLQAFTSGFTDCLPSSALFLLSPTEIAELSCGISLERGPLWTAAEMSTAIIAEHGYTNESAQVTWLVNVVSNQLTPAEQSKFLEFCTGCPRLPVGGLARIGKITVVKKDGDAAAGRDIASEFAVLPSVNTCFKYLKLPPYRTEEELKEKLLKAVRMAGDGFDLT